jgi:GNAT superfamily N-acetyltransferase
MMGEGAAVHSLVHDAYSPYIARMGRPPKPMDDDYDELVGKGVVWVLVDGEEILGILVLRSCGDHLLLENVAVSPSRQGQGLGRKLHEYTEDQARSLGLGEVWLYTNEAMIENIAMYKRFGYRETAREQGTFRRIFMSKSIS